MKVPPANCFDCEENDRLGIVDLSKAEASDDDGDDDGDDESDDE